MNKQISAATEIIIFLIVSALSLTYTLTAVHTLSQDKYQRLSDKSAINSSITVNTRTLIASDLLLMVESWDSSYGLDKLTITTTGYSKSFDVRTATSDEKRAIIKDLGILLGGNLTKTVTYTVTYARDSNGVYTYTHTLKIN